MEISANEIGKRIYTFRGVQVMLDNDLAEIYNVEVKELKRSVRRNIERFPSDFMFEPSREELQNSLEWRTNARRQFGTLGPDAKLLPYLPFAFTESGIAMLSSVLHSDRAIQVNIGIMRAFIQLRRQAKSYQIDLFSRVDSLERRMDQLEAQPQIKKPQDPVRLIQNIVARHWSLKREDLQSASRKKSIVLARQVAIYLARKEMHLSFGEIGQHFGHRDHTTIMHSYRKIEAASETNKFLQKTLNLLEATLRGIQLARLRSLPG